MTIIHALLALFSTSAHAAPLQNFSLGGGYDFVAPVVANETSLGGDTPTGLIYYEIGTGFKGISETGSPVLLSPARTSLVVNSSTAGQVAVEAALIINNGSTCVPTQVGNWLASATRNGLGDCTLNIITGTFSATPHCTVTAYGANSAINAAMAKISTDTGPNTSAIRVTTTNTGGTLSDLNFEIHCVGIH